MTMLFHGTIATCAHEHLAARAGAEPRDRVTDNTDNKCFPRTRGSGNGPAGPRLSVLSGLGPYITQKSAWHWAHRIRETWDRDGGLFGGPVEIDETYIGGKRLRYQDLISGNGLESGARSISI